MLVAASNFIGQAPKQIEVISAERFENEKLYFAANVRSPYESSAMNGESLKVKANGHFVVLAYS